MQLEGNVDEEELFDQLDLRMTFPNNTSFPLYHNQNYTSAGSSADDNIIHRTWIKLIICSLYCLIVICGIFGNCLVSFVVIRNKAMHTVTNSFIASLAVNDIIICALTIPLTPLYSYLEAWYFGSVMCHLFPLIQAASVFISTLTLTAIAVERFFVICFPYLPKLTTKSALFIILSIWVISIGICTPYAIYMKYNASGIDENGARCEEEWPRNDLARRTFGTVSIIVQYLIPLVVISFSYTAVWIKLRKQAAKGLTSRSRRGREPREPVALTRKKRTNRMLVAMVIIFSLCWLPLNLINVLNDYFTTTIAGWDYFVLFFFMAHILAGSSTCYNPILYAWMNENFRKEFKAVLPCFNTTRTSSLQRTETTMVDIEKHHLNNGQSAVIACDSESTYIFSTPRISRKQETNGPILHVPSYSIVVPSQKDQPVDFV